MKRMLLRPFLGTVLILFSASCSSVSAPERELEGANYSLEVYMVRASMAGADFEQYKVLPTGLYQECGMIRRGRSVTAQQNIIPLSGEVRGEVGGILKALTEQLTQQPSTTLPSPSDAVDMFDPGKFAFIATVDGEKINFTTTFDEIVNGEDEFRQAVVRLTELLRGVPSEPPCKNTDFYGMGRRIKDSF